MISDWIKEKLHLASQSASTAEYSSSLAECFEMANADVYTRSQMMLTNRAYNYFNEGEKIPLLAGFLAESAGLEKFQYVGCGDNAIVIRYSENQALRFRAPPVAGRINTQAVLQAPFISPVWKEVEFMGGRLNFVPFHKSLSIKIVSGEVGRSEGKKIIYALADAAFSYDPPMWFYDYYNYDFKYEQVALLDDGTPLIIDQGGVILEADAPPEYAERIEKEKESSRDMKNQIHGDWDQQWFDASGRSKISSLEMPSDRILKLKNVPDSN